MSSCASSTRSLPRIVEDSARREREVNPAERLGCEPRLLHRNRSKGDRAVERERVRLLREHELPLARDGAARDVGEALHSLLHAQHGERDRAAGEARRHLAARDGQIGVDRQRGSAGRSAFGRLCALEPEMNPLAAPCEREGAGAERHRLAADVDLRGEAADFHRSAVGNARRERSDRRGDPRAKRMQIGQREHGLVGRSGRCQDRGLHDLRGRLRPTLRERGQRRRRGLGRSRRRRLRRGGRAWSLLRDRQRARGDAARSAVGRELDSDSRYLERRMPMARGAHSTAELDRLRVARSPIPVPVSSPPDGSFHDSERSSTLIAVFEPLDAGAGASFPSVNRRSSRRRSATSSGSPSMTIPPPLAWTSRTERAALSSTRTVSRRASRPKAPRGRTRTSWSETAKKPGRTLPTSMSSLRRSPSLAMRLRTIGPNDAAPSRTSKTKTPPPTASAREALPSKRRVSLPTIETARAGGTGGSARRGPSGPAPDPRRSASPRAVDGGSGGRGGARNIGPMVTLEAPGPIIP